MEFKYFKLNLISVRMQPCVRPVDAASWPLAQMGSASNIQTTWRRL